MPELCRMNLLIITLTSSRTGLFTGFGLQCTLGCHYTYMYTETHPHTTYIDRALNPCYVTKLYNNVTKIRQSLNDEPIIIVRKISISKRFSNLNFQGNSTILYHLRQHVKCGEQIPVTLSYACGFPLVAP